MFWGCHGESEVRRIPDNRHDFVGTVPIFDLQDLQRSGCPEFLEFQPESIPVFKVK